MAKRRLLEWMRRRLYLHVEEAVDPPAERKAMDAAYRKAAPMVTRLVHKKFKPADMLVLEKYGVANAETEIKLTLPDARVVQFKLREDDAVKTADRYGSKMYLADHALMEAFDAHAKTVDAYEAETKRRQEAYRALIRSAAYVEDIVEVWKEAAALLPATALTAPLTPDQMALIRADTAQRKVA